MTSKTARPRSLLEIARSVLWTSEEELPAYRIDAALEEAGIDKTNQTERRRFQNLVNANYHFQVQEQFAQVGGFEAAARERAGEGAPEEEVLYHAYNMKQLHEDELEATE